MEQTFEQAAEQLSENLRLVRRYEPIALSVQHSLCALLLTDGEAVFDPVRINACKVLLRRSTPLLSQFQQNGFLTCVTLLALSEQPELLMERALRLYDLLKDSGLRAADHLVVTAFLLAALPTIEEPVLARLSQYYLHMKEAHPVLTNTDDYVYAAVLAVCCPQAEETIARLERLFDALKPELLMPSNGTQGLAAVLAAAPEEQAVLARTLLAQQALKKQRCDLFKTNGMPLLGVCALSGVAADEMAQMIACADACLRRCRGMGAFSVTTRERLTFAGSLAATRMLRQDERYAPFIRQAALVAVTTGTTVAVTTI